MYNLDSEHSQKRSSSVGLCVGLFYPRLKKSRPICSCMMGFHDNFKQNENY